MPRIFSLVLVAFTVLLIHGCNYELGEHYFVDVPKAEQENILINLSIAGDTLDINEDTKLTISDIGNLKNRAGIDVSFNNTYQRNLTEPEFTLAVNTLATGYYKLEIVVKMNSGSGSLADSEGLEVYATRRSWTVHVNTDAPQKVEFVSVKPSDGTLMLTWKESTDPRFGAYKIRKICNGSGCDNFEVTDVHQVNFNDTGYLGGYVEYYIQVVTKSQVESSSSGIGYSFDWKFNAEWEWIDATTARGKWRKHPFYNNVSQLTINDVAQADPNDTTVTITKGDLKFGQGFGVSFKYSPKHGDRKDGYVSVIYAGKKCHPRFYDLKYNKFDGRYYSIYNNQEIGPDTLYVFGDNKRVPIKALPLNVAPYSFMFSGDGKTMYMLGANSGTRVVEVDLESITVKKTYSWTLPGSSTNFAVTEDGKVLNSDKVYNLATGTVLFAGSGNIGTIAPDGSQLFLKTLRYVWNGTQFVEQGPAPFSVEPVSMKQYSGDSLVVIQSTSQFEIRQAQTNDVLYSKTASTGYFNSSTKYDHDSDLVGMNKFTEYEIYNIKTDVSRRIPYQGSVSFVNKYLICNRGYYLELE